MTVHKQDCVLGCPVSPVVANLCMEAIEEMAINTNPVPPYCGNGVMHHQKERS